MYDKKELEEFRQKLIDEIEAHDELGHREMYKKEWQELTIRNVKAEIKHGIELYLMREDPSAMEYWIWILARELDRQERGDI